LELCPSAAALRVRNADCSVRVSLNLAISTPSVLRPTPSFKHTRARATKPHTHTRHTSVPPQADDTLTPSTFLKSVLGRPTTVTLTSGVQYTGVLSCLDGYMNIAMEQTEEYVGGQLKAKYGDVFLRGNNVLYIAMKK